MTDLAQLDQHFFDVLMPAMRAGWRSYSPMTF